jgi:hypothetical protein
MGLFLFLMSVLFMAKGVGLILWPKKMVKFGLSVLKDKEPKVLAALHFAIGLLFLFSASLSILGWLIVLLGLSQIVLSVFIFQTSLDKIKSHWIFGLSDTGYRLLGILVLLLGVVIFISRV